jgi:Alw26I/Eco31I/Esp3I family type II restriction endonuclease
MAIRNWHPNFYIYMEMIATHDNYNGLAIEKKADGTYSWLATKNSEVGKKRLEWVEKKALELGIDISNPYYSKVMYEVHPTKEKVCQICGKKMYLSYVYPNKNFVKDYKRDFGYSPTAFDTIFDINNHLITEKIVKEQELIKYYCDKFGLDSSAQNKNLDQICIDIELLCRRGVKGMLGPGAMSNFPDRFDGFHSYNRCCRGTQDTGRHEDNMRSYSKDRRAYENWSDGNIHAANKFMSSKYFKGQSADHIGPISLGFIHDSRFLTPLSSGDNSAKNNKLDFLDIEKLILLEQEHSISAVSWYANIIWDWIKFEFARENRKLGFLNKIRRMLLENFAYFMEILWEILQVENDLGYDFLEEVFLKPKKDYFNYSYSFDKKGNIIKITKRNITAATEKEYPRFVRISFEAIEDFHKKENRNIKVNLLDFKDRVNGLKKSISAGYPLKTIKSELIDLTEDIQRSIIKKSNLKS